MRSDGTVLFVSPGPDLSNPVSGEGMRLRNLSRELSNRGWRVLTLVPEDTGDAVPEWVTKQYTYEQWSLPHLTDLNPSFVGALRRVLSEENVDVVHLSTGVCAAKVLTLFDSDTTIVYAAQNVEADHARDFVDPELPVYKRLLGPRLIPLIEWATAYCADGVTTVSEKDRDRFIERYGLDEKTVKAVPTGTTVVNRDELENPSDIRDRLGIDADFMAVFHGYYEHPPNREAAELIDREIAPAMAERDTDVAFLLVGKNPPEVSSPNVHAVGFVDDLLSVLNAADVAVVPILHGGGTKTKLYDYVGLSLPIVATEKAIEGVDLRPDEHALLTDEVDEDFVSRLIDVLEGEEKQKLRENLIHLAQEWNWTNSADNVESAYRASE
jgi:glycosyltransferase involved in cell wall biosynthesis